ncbi:hypothetical protein AAK964_07435 [Tissierella praeacuta]|uniref:hypothetical protein n=1 Tax=Tissierella praeacuta TaxID=43131 RepID=UPI0035130B5B
MNYNYTKTKKEIIIKNLKLLIDYKTLIAIIFLAVGYLKSFSYIFLLGSIYFALYLMVIVRSLLSKHKSISLNFIIGEEELIAKVENNQLIFPFRDIKAMKDSRHSLIIKMDKRSKASLNRLEIPYDLEDKHVEFIKELKYKYENYKPKDRAEESFEKSIIAFKLNPRKDVIRYIKYSKRIYFNVIISIICVFLSIMLIHKPQASIMFISIFILSWAGYYIDYRRIKIKGNLICSIEKIDDESLEIKGSAFKSVVNIKDVRLLSINDKEYIIKIEGITNDSYVFTKDEIIVGDIDNLVNAIGEPCISIGSQKLPFLSMIFAIISILFIPMVLTPLGTELSLYCNIIFFIISLILVIIALIKKNIIKRLAYIALFLDLLLLVFYIHIIIEVW